VVAAGLTQSTRFRRTSAKPWLDDLEVHSIESIAGQRLVAPPMGSRAIQSTSVTSRNLLELMAAG